MTIKQQMTDTIVLPVRCNNDECGMVSAYRFYLDGSFTKVLDACWHDKNIPTYTQVAEAFTRQEATQ